MLLFTRLSPMPWSRMLQNLTLEALQTDSRAASFARNKYVWPHFWPERHYVCWWSMHRDLLGQTGHRPGPKANQPMHRGLSRFHYPSDSTVIHPHNRSINQYDSIKKFSQINLPTFVKNIFFIYSPFNYTLPTE